MIDIHSHVLPGLDDGSQSITETLAMVKMAVREGITGIVATPHVISNTYPNSKEEIITKVKEVNEYLQSKQISCPIFPGAEIRLEPDLPERMAKAELLTINNTGRYLLVELPAGFVPPYTEQILYELQMQGVVPIIAHPERNSGFYQDPNRLANLVAKGMLLQITTASITGLFGHRTRKTALKLLSEKKAHLIGSDAHSAEGLRRPVLSPAYKEVKKLLGEKTADHLLFDNPARVIKGEAIEAPKPQHNRSHSFLRLWLAPMINQQNQRNSN